MTTASPPVDEWKDLPWRAIERRVFKLQTRIYRANRRGDVRAVHKLQRLLVTSWSARCLAVRRVTQDNQGKRTAGVDGIKALAPPQRLRLVRTLALTGKARPLRRVWIPKPGTTERRPLGIPTLHDRAAQALLTCALEPEWEAVFEPNSYGFRPGRSCHDAVVALTLGICHKPKYVLDADIAHCFDRIDHTALLAKLHASPTFRRPIRAWLKAGVLEGTDLFPTEAGTPQGGVVSPLLANIALHGLEAAITATVPQRVVRDGRRVWWRPLVVRYADDFVVLHEDRAVIEQCKQQAETWLRGMGLELKPSKTRIVHTLREHDGHAPGFDFLGYHIRQYPAGKTHAARVTAGKGRPSRRLGCRTRITPSTEAMKRHGQAIRAVIHQHRQAPQAGLIGRLNPLIRGWSSYYATVGASHAFTRMDHQMYLKLRRWANRRHPARGQRWVYRKYWRIHQGRRLFATADGTVLRKHADTRIRRHVKVRPDRSPYDGDWSYWATRTGTHPELPTRVSRLLWRQRGRCPWCGLYFRPEDRWELDHRIPRTQGGADQYDNWQLLHGHCHDRKTAEDNSYAATPLTTGQTIEEPDAGKLACPVLQTSRPGD